MNERTTAGLAAPRVVRSKELLIFGLSERYRGTNAGIPSQWERFAPYIGNIAGQVGNATYGVICNTDETGSIDYISGVEVKEFLNQPAGFARLRIPAQTYAVFEHREHVSTIGSAWKAIWSQGLADAGHKAADGPAFERYDQRFDPKTGTGGFEIWVPIIS